MASLIVQSGNQCGRQYPLGRRPNVIGRLESLPIQILDARVSRKHLKIRYDYLAHKYFVRDMHSRNGVFLNGARLDLEAALLDSDLIRVGDTELVFAARDPDACEEGLHSYKQPGERLRPTRTPENTWWIDKGLTTSENADN